MDLKIILGFVSLIVTIFIKYNEILDFFSLSKRHLRKYLYLRDEVKIDDKVQKEILDYEIKKWSFIRFTGLEYNYDNEKILEWYRSKMKTNFTLPELRSIAPYMKGEKKGYVVEVDTIKKDRKTRTIMSWFGLSVLVILIFLLRFNFFKKFVEQDEWYIYIYIAFLWGIAQITIMNRNYAIKTAKKYINFFYSEEDAEQEKIAK